jgi:hypothetical protein
MLFDCMCEYYDETWAEDIQPFVDRQLLFCCVILVLVLDRVPKVISNFSDVCAIEIYCHINADCVGR